MLADFELGDRQLPDQCSGAPGQIQWSVTKCVVVGPSDFNNIDCLNALIFGNISSACAKLSCQVKVVRDRIASGISEVLLIYGHHFGISLFRW